MFLAVEGYTLVVARFVVRTNFSQTSQSEARTTQTYDAADILLLSLDVIVSISSAVSYNIIPSGYHEENSHTGSRPYEDHLNISDMRHKITMLLIAIKLCVKFICVSNYTQIL